MGITRHIPAVSCCVLVTGLPLLFGPAAVEAEDRNWAYVELEGTAEAHRDYREWRSYYWREDFTLVVRDARGHEHRVISREPTPWTDRRLGTTYTGLKVDWSKRPRVQVIGVRAIDRIPPEFYNVELDPDHTITAFIVRVKTAPDAQWRDYYINNWFHHWGPEADRKVLPHYASENPNYTIFGFLEDCAAPFDAAGQELLKQSVDDWEGIIYHARLVKAENEIGYARQVLHLMGRHRRTREYAIFHGDPEQIPRLDQRKPQ